MPLSIEERLSAELSARVTQIHAAVDLLDSGATVPFIARYRKEATGGLDDAQLRQLAERLVYLRELDARRDSILSAIGGAGKLTDELRAQIDQADTKQRLEDLYAPFKVKRRSKAQLAIEAGLLPLADALLADPTLVPDEQAAFYLREPFVTEAGENPGVADVKGALEGARQILIERFAEDADLLEVLRTRMAGHALVVSRRAPEQAGATPSTRDDASKYRDYFEHQEPLRAIPSHRALAMLRGRREEVLRISLRLPEELGEEPLQQHPCEAVIAAHVGIAARGRAADAWLVQTARWTWSVRLSWQIESELIQTMREQAEEQAIAVFATNLRDVLLAPPAGQRATLGLDPGLRTGVKVAVVDATGRLLETSTIYPHVPARRWDESIEVLARICSRHQVALVAIGNGTASRETDQLVVELMRRHAQLGITKVVVSEAGASVYSASELASREFPELDVSLRGAVSIARRLQDPLAELVKIDPKSIGVGQYQHDVSQTRLARSLEAVVEDCVNAVGVDVNTASAALLTRISGLGRSLAENIVQYRDQHGAFRSRHDLLEVPRLGEKAFEQAAGFLRIVDGVEPLDASAVHPEAYPLARRILEDIGRRAGEVIGQPELLRAVQPQRFTDERFGLPTVQDILRELVKPGRDPRPAFRTASFLEGVTELADLRPDMVLEGVVTNVTAFGAFVDIGVHQDGLVHISALSHTFVRDAREVVKAGDIVRVRVMEVDLQRRRVALTMRLSDSAAVSAGRSGQGAPARPPRTRSDGRSAGGGGSGAVPADGVMASALARALVGRKG